MQFENVELIFEEFKSTTYEQFMKYVNTGYIVMIRSKYKHYICYVSYSYNEVINTMS